jgi:uracil DNA glycosylase
MDRHKKWREWYENEIQQPYFLKIMETAERFNAHTLLSPSREYWFRAFEFPDITKIHTIITGSRPHCEAYAADGFAFSSIDDTDREMGLLYRKLFTELGVTYDQYDNSKQKWLDRGILCMPMELTTVSGNGICNNTLWLPFTKRVLRYFIEDEQMRAFVFLDKYWWKANELFFDKQERPHLYIQSDIRDPAFQKERIFTLVNKFVEKNYNYNIDWQ